MRFANAWAVLQNLMPCSGPLRNTLEAIMYLDKHQFWPQSHMLRQLSDMRMPAGSCERSMSSPACLSYPRSADISFSGSWWWTLPTVPPCKTFLQTHGSRGCHLQHRCLFHLEGIQGPTDCSMTNPDGLQARVPGKWCHETASLHMWWGDVAST